MLKRKLTDWLSWIKTIHYKPVDLGLARVNEVAKRMDLLNPTCSVITVGGTNGKGSTVAGLEAIYVKAGYKVGCFTSPYLYKINEEFRISGKEVSDEDLCEAFEKVESTRNETQLTQFEFNTLAALYLFQKAKVDVCILEVGLGGCLDAVNIIDADVAIVASIGIDHSAELGETRDKIGLEKAGIYRKGKPAICGDFDPPDTLKDYVKKIGALFYCQNEQFGFEMEGFEWNWWSEKNKIIHLPVSQLATQNMATVLMAIELLQEKLPVKLAVIQDALKSVFLPGRIEVIPGDVTQIYDVSHNPAAVEMLVEYLKEHKTNGETYAVFSMLGDKDILGTLWIIKDLVDNWYIAPLNSDRAASISTLEYCFRKLNIENVKSFNSIKKAYLDCINKAKKGDRVVIFGSFHTVAESRAV